MHLVWTLLHISKRKNTLKGCAETRMRGLQRLTIHVGMSLNSGGASLRPPPRTTRLTRTPAVLSFYPLFPGHPDANLDVTHSHLARLDAPLDALILPSKLTKFNKVRQSSPMSVFQTTNE